MSSVEIISALKAQVHEKCRQQHSLTPVRWRLLVRSYLGVQGAVQPLQSLGVPVLSVQFTEVLEDTPVE